MVKLVEASWNQPFIEELCAFPNGDHDDQVDAASAAFRALMRQTTFHAVSVPQLRVTDFGRHQPL